MAEKTPARTSTAAPRRAKSVAAPAQKPASVRIDERIAALDDWRGATLKKVRRIITEADPRIVEEVKWQKPTNPMGVPTWCRDGILCTGEVYKDKVKLTFAKGAALPDPAGLFNASLGGNARRAIDLREGDAIDEAALAALVRAAALLNRGGEPATRSEKKPASKPTLLAGGNPQIQKGEGDAPVQAYIAAMPGWKREVGRRLDALVARVVPGVKKAVKWNTPFYGVEGEGWFLAFHCFTRYVKVTFFRGASLDPVPPVASKAPETRYLHIHEGEELDEARLEAWIEQASRLPGERL